MTPQKNFKVKKKNCYCLDSCVLLEKGDNTPPCNLP